METTQRQHLMSKYKHLILSIIFTASAILVSVLPLLIVVIANKEKYFLPTTGWRVSIGFIFVLLIFVSVTKGWTKRFNLPMWLVVLALTTHFLQPILADLELNLWMGALGSGLAIPLEKLGKYYYDLHIAFRNAKINSQAMAEANSKNTNSIIEAIKSIGSNDNNIIGR